jgi:hypothetical protein
MDAVKVDRDVAFVAMVCTRMLQASILNVSSVFSDVRCKCVYLDVAYVSHVCCKCFIWMLCMCYKSVFHVFQIHVSSVSSVFFCMLQVFASGCFQK